MTNSLELLMPAGSQTKMKIALDYGADAVYLGPPLYSLRARENHFDDEDLKASIDDVHQRNKKVYMTLNIFSRNRKLKPFREDIKTFAAMKPDAFIMSDPGLISVVKELAPEIPVHLSVQANCMNWESVKFWQRSLGVERIILSRELSIDEIKEIKQRVPDIELEAFVHGSICIAYSGRCLLSSYMDKRDANQGVCDNSCREKYRLFQSESFISDVSDPDQKLYEIDEDIHGTYILNAKDLCAIDHLQELIDAGVISFKVEGRTKSEFYAALVARAYRGALDDVIAGRSLNPKWRSLLDQLSNRGYHAGFMKGDPSSAGQNYESSQIYNKKFAFAGLVSAVNPDGSFQAEIKNRVDQNQNLLLITPGSADQDFVVDQLISPKGLTAQAAHSGSGLFTVIPKKENRLNVKKNSILIRRETP